MVDGLVWWWWGSFCKACMQIGYTCLHSDQQFEMEKYHDIQGCKRSIIVK